MSGSSMRHAISILHVGQPACLQGQAKKYFRTLPQAVREDAEAAIAALVHHFWKEQQVGVVDRLTAGQAPTQTVTAYKRLLDDRLESAGIVDEVWQLHYFVNGLRDPIQGMVVQHNCDTLAEAFQKAKGAENYIAKVHGTRQPLVTPIAEARTTSLERREARKRQQGDCSESIPRDRDERDSTERRPHTPSPDRRRSSSPRRHSDGRREDSRESRYNEHCRSSLRGRHGNQRDERFRSQSQRRSAGRGDVDHHRPPYQRQYGGRGGRSRSSGRYEDSYHTGSRQQTHHRQHKHVSFQDDCYKNGKPGHLARDGRSNSLN